MNKKLSDLIILAVLGAVGYAAYTDYQPLKKQDPAPLLRPKPLPLPFPVPQPTPCPKPRPKPWDPIVNASVEARPVEGGKVSPDGSVELTCDLPQEEKKRNVGGRDGAGLCVFTSIEYAGRYQNEPELLNFQENMRKELGGGDPEKVDKMMRKYAPNVKYLQHTGGDPEILKLAIKNGRGPCVTYDGNDVHYRGSIAHMVWLPHFDDKWACVSDNNFTKDDQFVWMSPDEFVKRWRGNGGGWCVILLKGPPPPVPHN